MLYTITYNAIKVLEVKLGIVDRWSWSASSMVWSDCCVLAWGLSRQEYAGHHLSWPFPACQPIAISFYAFHGGV